MTNRITAIWIALVFLIANVTILRIILALNRRKSTRSSQPPSPDQGLSRSDVLKVSDILNWEFEYARTTASEAMQDRHTMVNYYLLAVGIVASGVVAVRGQETTLPSATGTILLWLLCEFGWFDFLMLIRLRQAWHDSAQTMNQIKEFYFQHVPGFDYDTLRSAFRWQDHTLPRPEKLWTVFYYSAMLIGFLDSVAYVAGGVFLAMDATTSLPLSLLGVLVSFGLVFFGFHVWLYRAFLEPRPRRAGPEIADGDDE